MKRKLIVSSLEQATNMIKAFLTANALPVHKNLTVMFGWFARDLEDDDEVGCPCFVCDLGSLELGHVKTSNILVYVKIFFFFFLNVTRLYQVTEEKRMFFDQLEDGDYFDMKDAMLRFQDQRFVYRSGNILEVL